MSSALVLAQQAKTTVVPDELSYLPSTEWFKRSSSRPCTVVRYEDIAHHADQEYRAFRTVHPRIHTHSTLEESLARWIREIPVEDLANLIEETPDGLAADHNNGLSVRFTTWQRISMLFRIDPPFDVTVSIKIGVDDMHDLAMYTDQERLHARKIPIQSEFSILKGTFPDVSLVDIQTAGGKTAWVVGVAALALSSTRFSRLYADVKGKLRGVMFQGPVQIRIARLVLISAAGSTFDHFVKTIERLIPRLKDTTVHYVIWSKMSKDYSVAAAEALHNTVVFWVVPVKRVNEILRQSPHISVAVGITDEFTVDTPRERSVTAKSPVIKQMIAQATPQALCEATRGNRSWLKELLGGPLVEPRLIELQVRYRSWTMAQIACDQYCKLQLMTLTPFRPLIRNDLKALMPPSLHVFFARSKRVTLVSQILDSTVDMVPASLANVIVYSLRDYHPDPVAVAEFRTTLTQRNVPPTELQRLVEEIPSTQTHPSIACRTRLLERIGEFASQSCPICYREASPRIFGCCGYCVCETCFESCGVRCPFCRSPISTLYHRRDVMLQEEQSPDDAVESDPDYPSCPVMDGIDLQTDLATHAHRRNKQLTNLTMTLHVLKKHGYTRPLILVERQRERFNDVVDFSTYVNTDSLTRQTGFRVSRVDHILGGKATLFVKVKRQFDTPDPQPMALLSYGINEAFLVGTNLDWADSIVTVGNISSAILTQALGRIFRPRISRDNSKPMVCVCVWCFRVR